LEYLWKSYLGGIERETIVDLAVQVAMLSGQDGGPGWGTNGIGHTGIGKEHPFIGNPVDVGGLHQMITVCTDGLVGMIVRHNKDNVRR